MRTLTRILATVGLIVTVGSTASADVSVTLVQIGGTYNAGAGANPGDTLVLAIEYSITNGPNYSGVTLIDPAITVDGSVNTAVALTGAETGTATFTNPFPTTYSPTIPFAPLATGDVNWVSPNVAGGWEKATTASSGVVAPCTAGGIFCTRLGNATFTLTGLGGVLDIGGTLGGTATTIGGPNFADVTTAAGTTLGTFTIVGTVPEPTTASLLGLGLVGLTVAGRRRKN